MNFTTVKDITLPGNLTVKKMQHGNDILWEKGEEDYSKMSFFVQNLTSTAGTVRFNRSSHLSGMAVACYVWSSTNDSDWTYVGDPRNDISAGGSLTIPISANGRVYLKCTANQDGTGTLSGLSYSSGTDGYYSISCTVEHEIGGHIKSLLNYRGSIGANGAFYHLFTNSTNLKNAEKLYLYNNCYTRCYSQMFMSCTGLVKPPKKLPATTLSSNCYISMFYNCTSLETAPELPASTLKTNCYYMMFYGCSKLKYIKAMFTTTPSTNYTQDWVKNVSATGTFVKNASATWSVSGVNGIPSGWTVQTASA